MEALKNRYATPGGAFRVGLTRIKLSDIDCHVPSKAGIPVCMEHECSACEDACNVFGILALLTPVTNMQGQGLFWKAFEALCLQALIVKPGN